MTLTETITHALFKAYELYFIPQHSAPLMFCDIPDNMLAALYDWAKRIKNYDLRDIFEAEIQYRLRGTFPDDLEHRITRAAKTDRILVHFILKYEN